MIADQAVEGYLIENLKVPSKNQPPLTPHKPQSRVVSESYYFSTECSQYLCFSVYFSTNNTVYDRNLDVWTKSQQVAHSLIKSLHNSETECGTSREAGD